MNKPNSKYTRPQRNIGSKPKVWEHILTLVAQNAFQVSRRDGHAEYCALMAEQLDGRISYTPGIVRIRTQLPVTTVKVRNYADVNPLVKMGAEFVPVRHIAAGNHFTHYQQLITEMSLLEPSLVLRAAQKRAG